LDDAGEHEGPSAAAKARIIPSGRQARSGRAGHGAESRHRPNRALGGGRATACGLNDDGLVVGSCQRADGERVGLHLRGSQATLIAWDGAQQVRAMAINATGQVCGAYLPVGGQRPRAFVWQGGIAQDLGALGGDGAAAQALALNAAGVVVGISGQADLARPGAYVPRAFVWQSGVMTDLNQRLAAGSTDWVLRSAVGINARGQIIGQGRRGGVNRAYFALPV
jgi:probable HAF family extracellular repeat protein